MVTKACWVLTALMAALPVWAGQPPLRDGLVAVACTLARVETVAPAAARACRVERKAYPKSVISYLKPSGLIDSAAAPVSRAAWKAVKRLGPEARKDPRKLVEAVQAFIRVELEDASAPAAARAEATDWRKAWPKASAILKAGSADALGRVRLEVALLRSLGVPARPCLVSGRPWLQAWLQYLPEKRKALPGKRAGKTALPALGEWACAPALAEGELLEAWSLDSGELARVEWAPAQELSARLLESARAYYPLALSQQARACYEHLAAYGVLPLDAPRALSPAAGAFWMVAGEAWALEADGSLQALRDLFFLTPYVPHQAAWGREAAPSTRRMDLLAWALWTDRPGRCTWHAADSYDFRISKDKALGYQHYLRTSVRRPGLVMQGVAAGGFVEGMVLRADNLGLAEGAHVRLEDEADTGSANTVPLDARGVFQAAWPRLNGSGPWILRAEASMGTKQDSQRFLVPSGAWEAVTRNAGSCRCKGLEKPCESCHK